MLVLDHVFILVSPNAPEADALLELGLVEGASNEHPGQGTSNRRFFLANTTIEFLFIRDIAEAVNGAGKGLKLVERAIDCDASPFGLVARWKNENLEPDFPCWLYQPDYFPERMQFLVGMNWRNFAEPLCICMPPALPVRETQPSPSNPDWMLTGLEISVPISVASNTLQTFSQDDLISIRYNEDHRMKLSFNDGAQSQLRHFPDIPLIIEW